MVKTLKVPEDEFNAAISALLKTSATPASDITDKRPRKADAKKPGPVSKKRN